MYLSIIIPTYNEERRIEKTLRSVHSFLSAQKYTYEIIVVDDGSKDKTREIIRNLSVPRLRLVCYEKNQGKGHAVKIGMLEAKGDYRLFMDADNSTSIEHLSLFIPYFSSGKDVVIGSRRINGSRITLRQSWFRELLGSAFRLLVKITIPLGVKDSQNGFKAFSKKATDVIFPLQTISGLAFDVEILALARKAGFQIQEVPIEWKNDNASSLSTKKMIASVFELGKIRLKLWSGTYKK